MISDESSYLIAETRLERNSRGSVFKSLGRNVTEKFSLVNVCSTVAACLLFVPKINLIAVSGQSAGIRIDDILTVPLAISLYLFPYSRALSFRGLQILFLRFCGLAGLSFVLNYLLFKRGNILYVFRPMEYFLFAYMGYFYSQRRSLHTLALRLLAANGIVMVLQFFGLVGAFSSAQGQVSDVSGRVFGLTGGPYEVGVVVNICMAILIAESQISRGRKFLYFWISFCLILLTAARMPLVCELYLLLVLVLQKRGNFLKVIGPFFISIVFVAGLYIVVPSKVGSRSSQTFSTESLEAFGNSYSTASALPTGNLVPLETPETDDADRSWLLRCAKWSVALRTWQSNPLTWVLGAGPGFAGIALDGGWIRVLTENGLIGLLILVAFFRRIAVLHPAMQMALICVAINMTMIDVHIAARVMTLVFFFMGAYSGLLDNGVAPPFVLHGFRSSWPQLKKPVHTATFSSGRVEHTEATQA
jgi:hypothetical protein